MRVLFLLSIGLVKHATSYHLITAMIKAVCDEGHTVVVLQKEPEDEIPKEINRLPIIIKTIPYHAPDKENLIARYLAEIRYFHSCTKHITSDFDAVFIQSNTVAGFVVWALKKKIPKATITFNIQDIFPYNMAFSGRLREESKTFKILSAIQRYAYRHSDHIITISEDMKELLEKDGTNADKIEVIYNWSYQDEPYTNVDYSSVAHMFDSHYFNIVYAGNIGVMQNVEILIETAKLMQNDQTIWFHIIGNGVNKKKLEIKAEEYGINNISFWPMQPPELAPAIYCAADVNIIPLLKNVYKTALPSKTATCFACGKPIIFIIGKESKFGQKVARETSCQITEADNPEQIKESIYSAKKNKQAKGMISFYQENASRTKNSKKYAKIITALK